MSVLWLRCLQVTTARKTGRCVQRQLTTWVVLSLSSRYSHTLVSRFLLTDVGFETQDGRNRMEEAGLATGLKCLLLSTMNASDFVYQSKTAFVGSPYSQKQLVSSSGATCGLSKSMHTLLLVSHTLYLNCTPAASPSCSAHVDYAPALQAHEVASPHVVIGSGHMQLGSVKVGRGAGEALITWAIVPTTVQAQQPGLFLLHKRACTQPCLYLIAPDGMC
jgi:hypothetical protein